MTRAEAPSWLIAAHGAALVMHAVLVVAILGGSLTGLGIPGGANAAREGLFLWLIFLGYGVIFATIPIVALLSWWLLHRRGETASPAHRILAVLGLTPYGLIAVWAVVAWRFDL